MADTTSGSVSLHRAEWSSASCRGVGEDRIHGFRRFAIGGAESLRLFLCVVRTSNQRPGFDDLETHLKAGQSPFIELFRMDPAIDGQVISGWLEVLADRQDVGVGDLSDVLHEFQHLVVPFTDADHDAGLGDESLLANMSKNLQGAVVASLGTHRRVHAIDGLHVVGEDFWACIDNHLEVIKIAFEIAHQGFNRHVRAGGMDPADGVRPDGCAAVREIVAIDRSDHDVA